MPQYFNEAVNVATNQADNGGQDAPANHTEVEINQLHRSFSPSYNIPPTRTSLIIYKSNENPTKYVLEPLTFGLLPFWAKPNDASAVSRQNEKGPKYSKEIQGLAARYFNCRKESLDMSVWKSVRHSRCVVPIEGYFEWQKSTPRSDLWSFFFFFIHITPTTGERTQSIKTAICRHSQFLPARLRKQTVKIYLGSILASR